MTEKPNGWAVALERIEKEAAERSGFLDLGRLELTELPPALFDLTHLRELNLGIGLNESGKSLTGLRALPDLLVLSISGTDVTNLSLLSGLPALQSIDCSGTQVSDLAPLKGLPALQSIDCSGTQVSDGHCPRGGHLATAFQGSRLNARPRSCCDGHCCQRAGEIGPVGVRVTSPLFRRANEKLFVVHEAHPRFQR
jgi:hypothetical protein